MRGLRLQAGWGGALLALPRRWRPPQIADRYSRRVALLKRILPATGVALLLLVAAWPRLGPLIDSVRLGFPAIDLREARELKMVNPRYSGIDRHNRPYVVTATIGRQTPDRDDLMSLENPKADMDLRPGSTATVKAATGIYQAQAQLLDLFDDVNLLREDGTRFLTRSAHVDLTDNTAKGDEPIVGHGPSGDLTAQGFRILEKGDTVLFTGASDLVLNGSRANANPPRPPGLPDDVRKTAARVEAAASATPAVATAQTPPKSQPAAATKKAGTNAR